MVKHFFIRNYKIIIKKILLCILIIMVAFCCLYSQTDQFRCGFVSNEGIIRGLINEININDPVEVFGHVFNSLNDEIVIYPSENYYYYIFNVNGRTFWSSFCLPADKREKGILSFGYIEKSNDFKGEDPGASGGSKDFSRADGLIIEELNPFKYRVSYKNKIVIFNLHKLNLKPPGKIKFLEYEYLVGPNFDESGLQFFLIYNEKTSHFYWILNEEDDVPEKFNVDSCNILFGRRTGFVFYNDIVHSRKIMIGADAFNVLKNNWYDGPFDQLPDNYVRSGEIEIRKYIEAAYPADSGKIDKYGNFIQQEGVRVAIAPYYAYYSKDEIIDYVRECIKEKKDSSELFTCLTQQIFYMAD